MRRWIPLVLATAVLAGCSDEPQPLADELGRYTDSGDGCQQVVSAIAYADNTLKPAGQEQYQVFDDAVRSNIAAVAGTVALEVRDFPSRKTLDQARTLARVADETAAARTKGPQRVRSLRVYRREAMAMVLACAAEVPGL